MAISERLGASDLCSHLTKELQQRILQTTVNAYIDAVLSVGAVEKMADNLASRPTPRICTYTGTGVN